MKTLLFVCGLFILSMSPLFCQAQSIDYSFDALIERASDSDYKKADDMLRHMRDNGMSQEEILALIKTELSNAHSLSAVGTGGIILLCMLGLVAGSYVARIAVYGVVGWSEEARRRRVQEREMSESKE